MCIHRVLPFVIKVGRRDEYFFLRSPPYPSPSSQLSTRFNITFSFIIRFIPPRAWHHNPPRPPCTSPPAKKIYPYGTLTPRNNTDTRFPNPTTNPTGGGVAGELLRLLPHQLLPLVKPCTSVQGSNLRFETKVPIMIIIPKKATALSKEGRKELLVQ